MNVKRSLLCVAAVGLALSCSSSLFAARLVYPQAVVGSLTGGKFEIELRLGNTDPNTVWAGTIRLLEQTELKPMSDVDFRNEAGDRYPVENGAVPLELSPTGSRLLRISSSRFQVGVLAVETTSGVLDQLAASFYYFVSKDGTAVSDVIAVQGLREPHSDFRVMISSRPTFEVGIAVVAAKSLDAVDPGLVSPTEVELVAILNDGTRQSGTFQLGGSEALQKAVFPGAILPDLPHDGSIAQLEIASQDELYVTSLAVGSPPEFEDIQIGTAPADPSQEVPATGLKVDTSDRAAVAAFYKTYYRASEGVPPGWTGDERSCLPGHVTRAFDRALLRRINYFRAMAGVPGDVVFSQESSTMAQGTALMMVANNRASHNPQPFWVCYNEPGSIAAAKSNLFYLDDVPPDASIIDGYIRDDGHGNWMAGHRRWVLYPRQRVMGSGTAQTLRDSANALWVIGDFADGPQVRSSWPPAGYVPRQLVFPRWSFSYPDADFSGAQVSMSFAGQDVPVEQEEVKNGYGDNSLVWVPQLPALADSGDMKLSVVIKGVLVNGASTDFVYDVILMDPE